MKKLNDIFDEEYLPSSGTTTSHGTSSVIDNKQQEYNQETTPVLLPSVEDSTFVTLSRTSQQEKYGAGKPYRVVLRGKITK